MLRQLYMTDNLYAHFYQVVDFSFSKPLNLSPSSTFSPDLTPSIFHLCPYIRPSSPFPMPPESVPLSNRHIRQQDIYNSLKNLDSTQLSQFLDHYQKFKFRVFATHNPTIHSNPYWQWVVTHQLSAWQIENIIVDNSVAEHKFDVPPLWCFERIGQTVTQLADGRTLYIGGEYEDYYDPDFCIYNDVIVTHPDGRIEIYGYPRAVFPPTDFHTATLVGDYIYIIGSIGYVNERRYSHTPVYRLNIHSMKIEEIATRNSMGWVHDHSATLKDNRIIITGGKILPDADSPSLDNLDSWALNLNTLIWKKLTHRERDWQRFYVARVDGAELHLWEYDHLLFCLEAKQSDDVQRQQQQLTNSIGCSPNLDSYRQLFAPPMPHETPSDWDTDKEIIDYEKILFIDGIKVGYKSDRHCVQVIIEGKLTDELLELLQQNLRHKLSKVENMACDIITVKGMVRGQ